MENTATISSADVAAPFVEQTDEQKATEKFQALAKAVKEAHTNTLTKEAMLEMIAQMAETRALMKHTEAVSEELEPITGQEAFEKMQAEFAETAENFEAASEGKLLSLEAQLRAFEKGLQN